MTMSVRETREVREWAFEEARRYTGHHNTLSNQYPHKHTDFSHYMVSAAALLQYYQVLQDRLDRALSEGRGEDDPIISQDDTEDS